MAEQNSGGIIPIVVFGGMAAFFIIIISVINANTYLTAEPILDDLDFTQVRTNYSFTASNTTWVSIGNVLLYNGTLTVRNKTFTSSDVNANYTVYYNNGTLKLKSGGFLGRMQNGKKYNATYSYQNLSIERKTKLSVEKGIDGLAVVGNYLPLIILAIIGAVLLGLVITQSNLGNFGKGGSGSGGVL